MRKFILTLGLIMAFSINSSAQTENGYKPLDILTEFKDNPFTFFSEPLLLMSGDKDSSNAMTIGWGALGNIWGMPLPTMTVYVAPGRYTFRFLEKYKYFTVMKINDKVLEYMGTHSGRSGDKGKALGLHTAYTKNGTPYYTEATEVYECEIMYGSQLKESGFRNDVPKTMYRHFPPGVHYMYIGRVVGAWKK